MRKQALILTLAALIGTSALAEDWKPAGDRIKTRWAADVKPDNAWQEYPRPQMVRDNWQNLNGLWNYAVVTDRNDQDEVPLTDWDGKILVPFCIESSLSGVGRLLEPNQQLHYQRDFDINKRDDQRTILHFEAVDYQCEVWVNGKPVGTHKGGNTPFCFDITDASVDGKNELTVTVLDPTGEYQLRGKQIHRPGGIFYTRVSGIWQTVWLEQVPATYIGRIKIDTEIEPASIKVATTAAGDAPKATSVRLTAGLDGKKVAEATGKLDGTTVKIDGAKLWSPSDPTLYDLKVELLAGETVVDTVDSYIGIRKVGRRKDAKGHWRFTLNDKEIFHLGPLDQGWWPDGLLTPPSDEAMLFDIEYLKDAGFNMIRNHIKVRPRRYYYHCDKMGMMVWQDQVSGQPGPGWTRMKPNPPVRDWPEAAHQQFMYELKEMIDTIYNSLCIVMWVPFNESWGQHRTMKIGKWVSTYDPTRHNNVASGGNFWPIGDVADHHSYPHPAFPTDDPRFADYIKVVGEFGGHGFVADTKHLWNPGAKNWGYGGLPKSKEELLQRYKTSIRMLRQLRDAGIAGGVYTQTTDVENEVNGLITYDREIIKFPAADLAKIHAMLLARRAQMETVLPLARARQDQWQYTTEKPADDWYKPGFDASGWKRGQGGFGTHVTPNTCVKTVWDSKAIWVRTEFDYEPGEGEVLLNIHYDQDPIVYINGIKAAQLEGYTVAAVLAEIAPEALASLKMGKNTLAVYCQNTFGGQYIDVGLLRIKPLEKE